MQSLKWKRPKRIQWIVIGLCVAPFLNLLHYANQYQLGFGELKVLFLNLPNLAIPFLITPFLLAYGIYHAKPWAYFSFLGFAILLVGYNVYVSFKVQSLRNYSASLQSLFLLVVIGILLNEEISAPYINPGVRGWRLKKRKKMEIPVRVNGIQTRTKDISRVGAYLDIDPNLFELGKLISMEIGLKTEMLLVEAEVLRVGDLGIGVSFRNLSKVKLQILNNYIKQNEE